MFTSINPASGATIATYPGHDADAVETILGRAAEAHQTWRRFSMTERAGLLRQVAGQLRSQRHDLAQLISREMGKLLAEAVGEVDKCAWVCDYYAEHGGDFLADELIDSDAHRSLVSYQPLGCILAVMPWNFPFWQVFRCAAPAIMAGNSLLLKHASNVPGCALAIEEVFSAAGLPEGVFSSLMINAADVARVIGDPRVQAVSLTGSEAAGRQVAALAGQHLKKCVLELGGSDAFIVLADADISQAATQALQSRFLNNGQSCIAAKRFIVEKSVAPQFSRLLLENLQQLQAGDPLSTNTTLAPLAREDLRSELHQQVTESVQAGARLLAGGHPLPGAGYFYAATLLDEVTPAMPVFQQETFGPVAVICHADDAQQAMALANHSDFGLGGSIWTGNPEQGEQLARQLECGCAFVNGMVKSDPRLPFGGIKNSGYGRELSLAGIREFVNAKTIWIG